MARDEVDFDHPRMCFSAKHVAPNGQELIVNVYLGDVSDVRRSLSYVEYDRRWAMTPHELKLYNADKGYIFSRFRCGQIDIHLTKQERRLTLGIFFERSEDTTAFPFNHPAMLAATF